MSTHAEPGDVVQLDPGKTHWGPVLCVVESRHAWGVMAYWFSHNSGPTGPATIRDTGAAYVRVPHGSYVVIGKAEWTMQKAQLTGE